MVIEPFTWIKTTAFKERVQLANKLNEVISVLNQYPVNIEDIDLNVSADGIFTFVFTLSDGTIKEMSFSMGDYITNEITSALTDYATKSYVDTKDSQNVKKTGVSEVTGDIRVPTTPANPLTVVNSVYVNDVTEGVNNIVHKTGTEKITGNKEFNLIYYNTLFKKYDNIDITDPPTDVQYSWVIRFVDKNFVGIGRIEFRIYSDGRTGLFAVVRNANGTDKIQQIVLGDA